MKTITKEISGYSKRPIKVLQFGEGNFLRAFVDYMIDITNEKGLFSGNVVLVKPIPKNKVDTYTIFQEQECQYTVILRGKIKGETVTQKRKISSVEEIISVYDEYTKFLSMAQIDSLRVVISNTTEAGITYQENDTLQDLPNGTYPAKLTGFLYERFKFFHGELDKGLYILPVELIDHNGTLLEQYVHQYSERWHLEKEFDAWVSNACTFCNTLVDRIVPGYPKDEAADICDELGYQDALLDVAEPFGLWVIENKKNIKEEFPLDQAGMPVLFVQDVKPYKQRKVRILNGAHTSFVLASYLAGNDYVLESMQDQDVKKFLMKVLYEEVLPTLTLPEKEVREFTEAVLERFENPFIKHQLLSISLNSVSKWRTRCLPSLLSYWEKYQKLPIHLTFSIAALIEFYHLEEKKEDIYLGMRKGKGIYQIQDDESVLSFFWANRNKKEDELVEAYLAREDFHGQNLTEVPGLCAMVSKYLKWIRKEGMRGAVQLLEQS